MTSFPPNIITKQLSDMTKYSYYIKRLIEVVAVKLASGLKANNINMIHTKNVRNLNIMYNARR